MPMNGGLTAREFQVLRCAAMGKDSCATAEELKLSPLTVKSHRRRILIKLEIQGRGIQYAVTWAYRNRLMIPTEPPIPYQLSPRRMDVLIGVANGLSNGQIATQLGVTEDTVKTHVRLIMGQMGASNRTHLVGLAFHTGTLVLIPRSTPNPGNK